jgi:hypothetical protein
VDRSAPLFREIGGTDSDVLAIRNRRSAAWTDVNLAVYTVETTGTEGPPSKSAHNLTPGDMMPLQTAMLVAATRRPPSRLAHTGGGRRPHSAPMHPGTRTAFDTASRECLRVGSPSSELKTKIEDRPAGSD